VESILNMRSQQCKHLPFVPVAPLMIDFDNYDFILETDIYWKKPWKMSIQAQTLSPILYFDTCGALLLLNVLSLSRSSTVILHSEENSFISALQTVYQLH